MNTSTDTTPTHLPHGALEAMRWPMWVATNQRLVSVLPVGQVPLAERLATFAGPGGAIFAIVAVRRPSWWRRLLGVAG